MEKKNRIIYITTPIYYVNASPHIGHAYTTIIADILSRYYTLCGFKVFFSTGTDEHGDKIVSAAKNMNMLPKEYSDKISKLFQNLWLELKITNTNFIRTTDEVHIKTVQEILQKIYNSGDIYFGKYEGLYCTECEQFYQESDLIKGYCPNHKIKLEYRKESNYFFMMSKYQDWLIKYINDHKTFIQPERFRNEILAFLKNPLEDLCISRPKKRLTWGINLPFDNEYVTYVWFDALINYLTGINYPDKKFKKFWPSTQHLIAKDILKPHAIYWPIILKAAGLEPYKNLNVHGYWNLNQDKISKSLGNIVCPLKLKKKYGLDALRYFLSREMVFGLDSNFNEQAMINRINSDLANDLGNLVSRIIMMAIKYCDGKVPSYIQKDNNIFLQKDNLFLIQNLEKILCNIELFFRNLNLQKILLSIWEFIKIINKYIVEKKPWIMFKSSGLQNQLNYTIYNLLESLRMISILISPFMPDCAKKIQIQLGINFLDQNLISFKSLKDWGRLKPFTIIKKTDQIFPRIDIKNKKQILS